MTTKMQVKPPEVGEVWPRTHGDGRDNGTQTVVLVRRIYSDSIECYSVLTVLSKGTYRYQTWKLSWIGRSQITSYRNFPNAYDDWRKR